MKRALNLSNAKNHLSPVWSRLSDVVIEKGAGSFVYTTCGRKLLDFTSGIGVTNTGHCHPKVVAAAQEQMAKLTHIQMGVAYHQPVLELAEELKTVVPKGLDQFFFSSSGSEAVEGALKLARHATGRPNVITFQGSFHGRTMGAMSMTNSKAVYRLGNAPLMSGVHVAPYAYCYRCPMKKGPVSGFSPTNQQTNQSSSCGSGNCCNDPLLQIENILTTITSPSETAAILLVSTLPLGIT